MDMPAPKKCMASDNDFLADIAKRITPRILTFLCSGFVNIMAKVITHHYSGNSSNYGPQQTSVARKITKRKAKYSAHYRHEGGGSNFFLFPGGACSLVVVMFLLMSLM